jgi:hypothetical protein
MTVTNPGTTTYEFNVELPDGASLGTMGGQPALPQPGDVLELFPQQVASYYEVRTRRFTTGGRIVVIVNPV